ncbi:MAG: FkbM family methyltransferase [Lachnospiraceae bacterium]|jgi:FkbM family methyltransferase|nr:FkbM family methyltransferase [Lachnospiraceae bacterium]
MNRTQLEQILSTKSVKYKEGNKLIVWGAGATADLYMEAFQRLKKEGFYIDGYCDNNPNIQGKSYNGKTVYCPSDLPKDAFICVCTAQPEVYRAIAEQLEEMELSYCHIDEMIFKSHKQELLKVYDLLEDDTSKEIYAKLIVSRMFGIYPDEDLYSGEQYFCVNEFRKRTIGEVFVDCGAYVGDTIEQLLWMRGGGILKKIIAIDADHKNYEALKIRIKRLKEEWNIADEEIELVEAAVGAETAEQGYYIETYDENRGMGSRMKKCNDNSKSEMKMIALDDFLTEPYTFLKADIEGFEYNMLLGAQNSIVRYKPKIAVCIYHNSVDFYDIPLLIYSFESGYKFAVRHHSNKWDETVLYAWCE